MTEHLVKRGHVIGAPAMKRVQTQRMAGHVDRIKSDALQRGGKSSPLHNLSQDRFVDRW